MLHSYSTPILAEANGFALNEDTKSVYSKLRELPFADFCELMFIVPSCYKGLRKLLPTMPADDIQKRWTGHSGHQLLAKSCNIVRLFQTISYRINGRGLERCNLLDYGCGWGRLMRLMNYFTDQESLYGVDPMQLSLDVCREHRVNGELALCQSVPSDLPFRGVKFDFVYSYSVFTHTSEDSSRAIMRAVRRQISDKGIFVITVRPIEFWEVRRPTFGDAKVQELIDKHSSIGFAFEPTTLDGKSSSSTYGETSMSFEYLRQMAATEGWKLALIDCDVQEPYQIMVALTPS
ncbi:MAG: class I SAM-dependent methyltransferase [Azonexus sp.]